MQELSAKTGDILEYDGEHYRVMENRIKRGEEKRKAVINLNIIAIPTIAIVYFGCLFILLIINDGSTEPTNYTSSGFFLNFIIAIVSFLVYIIVHEYTHYLAYRIFGKTKKKNLKFGFVLKSAMAYCIAITPNTVKASRLSLMMPIYALIIPLIIIALIFQSTFLILLASIFASGSCGDIWYMWTLRKDAKDKYIIEAMPASDGYEIGYLVLEKIE